MKTNLLVLLLCVMLASCTAEVLEEENVVLPGSNLADLGLAVDLDALKPYTDPDVSYVPGREFGYRVGPSYFDHNIDVLGFDCKGEGLTIETINAMYLQGYEKNADSDAEQLIEVNAKVNSILELRVYSVSELREYKLFEDDEVLVFDITDLLYDDDFAERNAGVIAGRQWVLDVYEDLRSYEDVKIVYQDNH